VRAAAAGGGDDSQGLAEGGRGEEAESEQEGDSSGESHRVNFFVLLRG
jgi:hypothetical protein